MQSLIPVVLSGGSGTRLWPLSREKYPKQLLPLTGEESLLQATVRRMDGLAGVEIGVPLIVCNEEYRFVIAEQLRLMGKKGTIVLEPAGRNTAPALTLAALAAEQGKNDPILLVMPADHVIVDVQKFQEVVSSGIGFADQGAIVTFGVTPESPETGYGYIQAGEPLSPEDHAFRIVRFAEKPDLARAKAYVEAGSYFWNSGLFMMRASVWLSSMEICRNDILAACSRAWDHRSVDGDFIRVKK
ncbi:MAG TPA: sugar phosphate nucleotidyltransferase, partial [Nitrosospira sp.]